MEQGEGCRPPSSSGIFKIPNEAQAVLTTRKWGQHSGSVFMAEPRLRGCALAEQQAHTTPYQWHNRVCLHNWRRLFTSPPCKASRFSIFKDVSR